MKVLVGLGNPPQRYANTRHNVGAEVVDLLARRWGTDVRSLRWHSLSGRARVGEEEVLLLKPMTYMNESGRAVSAALTDRGVEPGDLLVVSDDASLELGRVRMRRKGSAGGHRGIRSVMDHLGTDDFARLRIGIGCAVGSAYLRDHVLSEFTNEERKILAPRLEAAADAAEDFVLNGIDHAMNLFNA